MARQDQNAVRAGIAIDLVTMFREASIEGRLFGGAAFAVGSYWDGIFRISRRVNDIDIVVPVGGLKEIPSVVADLGGSVNRATVMLNDGRLIKASFRGLLVDIYSDPLHLNQTIELGARLDLETYTLAPADLLATKLQIHKHTENDVRDVIALLAAFEFSELDEAGALNVTRIVQLCSQTWNFYYATKKSLSFTMATLDQFRIDARTRQTVSDRISFIDSSLERSHKPWLWKLRQFVGPRWRWYNEI